MRVAGSVADLLNEEPQLPNRLHGGLPSLEFELNKTALLCVDMQRHLATPGLGPKAEAARAKGLEAELKYYWSRLELATRNLQRLQDAFRRAKLEVIHSKGGRLTPDGRDRGPMKSQLKAGRSSPDRTGEVHELDTEIIDQLAPLPHELVFEKNGATAFGMTRIDLALWQLEIEALVIGGVITNQCVEATVRGAFDHGFGVLLVEDACATYSEELQRGTLRSIGDWFCKVVTTDEVLTWFD